MKTLNGDLASGFINVGKCWTTFHDPNVSVYFSGSLFVSEVAENPVSDPARQIADLFQKKGTDCFYDLDGTYLLVIKKGSDIYLIRDRFGSGPQVYFDKNGFTTSIRNLPELSKSTPEPDWKNLSGFLQFGYIPAPGTGLAGVSKLPGGVILKWNGREWSTVSIYTAADYHDKGNPSRINIREAVEQYKFYHQQAIKKRIAGAGTVGVLLSGGYDSAGNIAALRELYTGKVQAFSIGFKDNPWSEIPQAKQMADKIGADFHEYEIDGSELNEIPELIRHLGDPFQEGGLMVNYTAMRLAGGHKPDIVLGGDGNDQHFGTSAKELAMNKMIKNLGLRFLQKAFFEFDRNKTDAHDDILFRYSFHNRKILNILTMDAFGFSKGELHSLGLKNADMYQYGIPASLRQSSDFNEFFFQRQYYVDVKQVINEVILFKAGQNASLRDITIGFPYMDKDLAGFLSALPRDLRFAGSFCELLRGKGKSKFIHRKLYESSMPKELSSKKKQGGFAPLPLFFQSSANLDLIEQVILQSGLIDSGIDRVWVTGFIQRYRTEIQYREKWFWYSQVQAFKLFNLLVLAVWWETVIKGRYVSKLTELI